MKKIVLVFVIPIVLSVLMFFCDNRMQNNKKLIDSSQVTDSTEMDSQLQTVNKIAGNPYANIILNPSQYIKMNNNSDHRIAVCKEAYASFLRNYFGSTNYAVHEFALRDLDNNGMPEILVVQSNEDGGILTVYSYNGEIYKIGDYSDSKIGISAFVVPENPELQGLFNLWWGGGIEHYGYLSVKDSNLTYEELYYIDRTGDAPEQVNISNNTELIERASNDFLETDKKGDNTLDMYLINEENISKILG